MNPFAFRFFTTVASYGETYPLSIFEPQVQGWPSTLMRSFIAIGTAFGFAFASASAPSSSNVRYAPTPPSAAWTRLMTDLTKSSLVNSPFASPS